MSLLSLSLFLSFFLSLSHSLSVCLCVSLSHKSSETVCVVCLHWEWVCALEECVWWLLHCVVIRCFGQLSILTRSGDSLSEWENVCVCDCDSNRYIVSDCVHIYTHSPFHSISLNHSTSLSLSLSLNHSTSLSLSFSQSHTHIVSLSLSLNHTHALTGHSGERVEFDSQPSIKAQ